MATKKVAKSKFVNHYKADFVWSEEDAAFIASVPEIPGLMTHGETLVEAARMLDEAVEAWVMSQESRGLTVPEPIAHHKYSGKIALRIKPVVHSKIALRALVAKKSVNKMIEEILEEHADVG
jgi:predicted RNase H-like HicB family nuclease